MTEIRSRVRRLIAVFASLLLFPTSACGESKVDASGPSSVAQYALFETTGTIELPIRNPFDPAQLDLTGLFVDPRGEMTEVPGFYFQDFDRRLVNGREVLTPKGEPVWKVRFTPRRPGRWSWQWEVRTRDQRIVTKRRDFHVAPSSARGFVRFSPRDPRYLVFDDGTPYFAIGENVPWYEPPRGTFDYDRVYARLAEHGANANRLWMPLWAFGLEGTDTGVGDYTKRLDRAWRLDHVISLGERFGILAAISFFNQADWIGGVPAHRSEAWYSNPYNEANGGPFTKPADIFETPVPELIKRRLRYIIARWGYSPAVYAWEIWNEVDGVTGYDRERARAWHVEIVDELRRLDPFDHLVSTSAVAPDAELAATVDYGQAHLYMNQIRDPYLDTTPKAVRWIVDALNGDGQFPVLVAEFGVSNNEVGAAELDPNGDGIRQALWSTALSGSFGAAMPWWWKQIDRKPTTFYPIFASITNFLRDTRWDREAFAPTRANAQSPTRRLSTYGLTGKTRWLVWVVDESRPAGQVLDATLNLGRLPSGCWRATWWATQANRPIRVTTLREPRVAIPGFTNDVGLRLDRC